MNYLSSFFFTGVEQRRDLDTVDDERDARERTLR
jgi:hypothetical protein